MTGRFDLHETSIAGLLVLQRQQLGDDRGYLERLYDSEELPYLGRGLPIVQVNRTLTRKKGTIRGMHFQRQPHSETKFVSCFRGQVLDVAVDLRRGSPTFLKWHAELLGEDRQNTLVIPEGFAHGFQTLTDDVEMLYFHTAPYRPASEGGLNPLDPRLSIAWPLPVEMLSPRDAAHPMLSADAQEVML